MGPTIEADLEIYWLPTFACISSWPTSATYISDQNKNHKKVFWFCAKVSSYPNFVANTYRFDFSFLKECLHWQLSVCVWVVQRHRFDLFWRIFSGTCFDWGKISFLQLAENPNFAEAQHQIRSVINSADGATVQQKDGGTVWTVSARKCIFWQLITRICWSSGFGPVFGLLLHFSRSFSIICQILVQNLFPLLLVTTHWSTFFSQLLPAILCTLFELLVLLLWLWC